jgi:Fic family protein
MDGYNHILFKRHWDFTPKTLYQLGESEALVQAIANTPLKPENRQKLLLVSLIKGAQATTAIEGNTLSEEEIEKLQEGWKLPPSKEYQEIEVKNIIDAFNALLQEVCIEGSSRLITPDLIKEFHQMISKNLGDHLDAIPGRFREDNRVVGTYRAPDYKYVPNLVEKLCQWIRKEFHYENDQNFHTSIVQAIVTHVYIEWIHPFGDGNGRTGRLLEFYVLLRAGLPSIVSHILSNFYNNTRPEYYRQLDNARKVKKLTSFIEYAVEGFRDGLKENLKVIQESQFYIFWHNYIYESFADIKYTKREAFKRKRDLMLTLPLNKTYLADDIVLINPTIAKKYGKVTKATILRDLKELLGMKLLVKEGRKYRANSDVLRSLTPDRKTKN